MDSTAEPLLGSYSVKDQAEFIQELVSGSDDFIPHTISFRLLRAGDTLARCKPFTDAPPQVVFKRIVSLA
jgi:hypothetical protein